MSKRTFTFLDTFRICRAHGLTIGQFSAVIRHLESRGFTYRHSAKKGV